jgi:hypothetical protein
MKVDIVFAAADLSTSQVSDKFEIPEGVDGINADIGFPTTGAPVGVLTIEECLHGDPNGDWQPYSKDGSTTLSTAVNGTSAAGYLHFRDIAIAGPRFARFRYVRTSGGTGARFNDCSTSANNAPIVSFAS